jgi:hypothetical protein
MNTYAHMAIDDFGMVVFGSDDVTEVIDWTDKHDFYAQHYSIVSRNGNPLEVEIELFAANTINRLPA